MILRRAARQAQSRGATDAAVVNLTRAWQEPPPPEVVGDVAAQPRRAGPPVLGTHSACRKQDDYNQAQ